MSATLQIIPVMKTLGAITPKDHSIASVNHAGYDGDGHNCTGKIICMRLINESTFSFLKNCDQAIFFSSGEGESIEIQGGHVRR